MLLKLRLRRLTKNRNHLVNPLAISCQRNTIIIRSCIRESMNRNTICDTLAVKYDQRAFVINRDHHRTSAHLFPDLTNITLFEEYLLNESILRDSNAMISGFNFIIIAFLHNSTLSRSTKHLDAIFQLLDDNFINLGIIIQSSFQIFNLLDKLRSLCLIYIISILRECLNTHISNGSCLL